MRKLDAARATTVAVTERKGLTTASLFKYLPPERKDVFQTHCLRYSQPAVFSDPFEAKPHFTGFAPTVGLEGAYPRRFEKLLREQYQAMSSAIREQTPYLVFAALLEPQRPIIYETFRKVDASFVPEIKMR
jgi:hypothetical protein